MAESEPLDSRQMGETGEQLLEFLKSRIKGQDHEVLGIAKLIDCSDSDFWDSAKPILRALLVGPESVGKMLLVRSVAEFWFGSPDAFVEISCPQLKYYNFQDLRLKQANLNHFGMNHLYRNNPAVKKLFDKQNKLMKRKEKLEQKKLGAVSMKVKNSLFRLESAIQETSSEINWHYSRVKSIVVFNHLEGASPDSLTFIADILRQGHCTFEDGSQTSFQNSLIFALCDSVVPYRETPKKKEKIGFTAETDLPKSNGNGETRVYLNSIGDVMEYFNLELLNNFDRISVFRAMNGKVLKEILEIYLRNFLTALSKNFPVTLNISEEVKNFVVQQASDHLAQGARLLEKKFYKYIVSPLERLKQNKFINPGDKLTLKVGQNSAGKTDVLFFKS